MTDPVKVTVTDPDTGEVLGEQIVDDDYVVVCAGRCTLDQTFVHVNGTHQLTIKNARRSRRVKS